MENLSKKETEERVKAIIRVAKAIKSQYEKETKQTFPIINFIDQVLEKEPYKDFSDKTKKKAKELSKFL